MSERYKLIYKDEDAWEHEWDIEDTLKHTVIFQHGRMIVDELNKLNNENNQLQSERNYFERKKNEYLTGWNECKLVNAELKHENHGIQNKVWSLLEVLEKEHNIDKRKIIDWWNSN